MVARAGTGCGVLSIRDGVGCRSSPRRADGPGTRGSTEHQGSRNDGQGIAPRVYGDHAHRQQDVAAQWRLLNAVLWLRERAAEDAPMPLAGRLDNLPAELRSAHRPITVSADGTALETPSYTRRDDMERLRVPLPQAMLAR